MYLIIVLSNGFVGSNNFLILLSLFQSLNSLSYQKIYENWKIIIALKGDDRHKKNKQGGHTITGDKYFSSTKARERIFKLNHPSPSSPEKKMFFCFDTSLKYTY